MNPFTKTTENGKNKRDAFGRIAQPYSGAASRVVSQAKLVRGLRTSNSFHS